jgi:hypothetical protein
VPECHVGYAPRLQPSVSLEDIIMRDCLLATLVCAAFSIASLPVFAEEKPPMDIFRCGNAPLTAENRALWPVLGEWEGASNSGRNILLHQVGCDGRILVFSRPANGDGYYHQMTLSSYYRFVHAPAYYVIEVSTPEDPKHPEKQVGMTLYTKNRMKFDIEFFNHVDLMRTSREICNQAANAIKESFEIVMFPENHFPQYSELMNEQRALWPVFVALEKRDSWVQAKKKVSEVLEKARAGKYLDLKTGETINIPLSDYCELIGKLTNPLCFAYNANKGAAFLAYAIVALRAAETDEYVRNLLKSPGVPNLKSLIARFGGMLEDMKEKEEYYWNNLEIIRNNQCRDKYGPSGSYPTNSRFPNVPYSPIEIEAYLQPSGTTKEQFMENGLSSLLKFAKQIQGYQ